MAVNGILNSAAVAAPVTPTAKNQLDMQTFIKLLTVQLSNQDPLQPTSSTDFFAQLAQLGQVQGIDQLNKDSAVQKAQSLMGQTITAFNPNATPGTTQTVTGVATKLSLKNGVYWLTLNPASGLPVDVSMDSIQNVQPTPNILQANLMIGRTVTGNAMVTVGNAQQSTSVVGTVMGASVVNGDVQLEVNTQNYGTVGVPIETVTNVG